MNRFEKILKVYRMSVKKSLLSQAGHWLLSRGLYNLLNGNFIKMIILIVEDDERRAQDLRNYMQTRSVKVLLAQDGYEAMTLLNSHKVDLILSDANMPAMDGYILAKNVKKDISMKNTPFFIYSSRELPEDNRNLALRLGADRCLQK